MCAYVSFLRGSWSVHLRDKLLHFPRRPHTSTFYNWCFTFLSPASAPALSFVAVFEAVFDLFIVLCNCLKLTVIHRLECPCALQRWSCFRCLQNWQKWSEECRLLLCSVSELMKQKESLVVVKNCHLVSSIYYSLLQLVILRSKLLQKRALLRSSR